MNKKEKETTAIILFIMLVSLGVILGILLSINDRVKNIDKKISTEKIGEPCH